MELPVSLFDLSAGGCNRWIEAAEHHPHPGSIAAVAGFHPCRPQIPENQVSTQSVGSMDPSYGATQPPVGWAEPKASFNGGAGLAIVFKTIVQLDRLMNRSVLPPVTVSPGQDHALSP